MSNIEGIDFCKQQHEAGCTLLAKGQVAISSGYLTIHYMNEMNAMGIYSLGKPFELKELYAWNEQCQARADEFPLTLALPASEEREP